MNNRARSVKTAKYKLGRRSLRKYLVAYLRHDNALRPEYERAITESLDLPETVSIDRNEDVL